MKRHLDIDLLDDVIRKLASGEQLPEEIVALRASSRIYELSVQLLPSAFISGASNIKTPYPQK